MNGRNVLYESTFGYFIWDFLGVRPICFCLHFILLFSWIRENLRRHIIILLISTEWTLIIWYFVSCWFPVFLFSFTTVVSDHVSRVALLLRVSRHFGPRTLQTHDISVPSDWCRSVRAVRHQCQLSCGHFGTSKHLFATCGLLFCCSRPYRRMV